jgi:lipid-A-disaccharide synthase-like uncharacterized protein
MIADVSTHFAAWFHAVFVDKFDRWVAFGFLAQVFFMLRFALQWIASERARRSVVPMSFWVFSMFGGLLLLVYAIHQRDPVFIIGLAGGLFIYSRNLWFVLRERREIAAKAG